MRGRKPTPQPSSGKPPTLPPPAFLCPVAVAEWRRIVRLMIKRGRALEELDTTALMVYCTSVATYRRANEKLAELGDVIVGNAGQAQKNPYATVAKEAWDRIRPLLSEFGFTPCARGRAGMGFGDDDEDGDLDI